MNDATQSAGLLMYRNVENTIEVFLCRPFTINDDRNNYWGIPKGRIDNDESPEEAAKREFFEETGLRPPNVPKYYLGKVRYPSGKKEVSVWTFEFNPPKNFAFKSNFTKVKDDDGNVVVIPEIGEWAWFTIQDAEKAITRAQREIIQRFKRFILKNNNFYGTKGFEKGSRTSSGKDRLPSISRFGKSF